MHTPKANNGRTAQGTRTWAVALRYVCLYGAALLMLMPVSFKANAAATKQWHSLPDIQRTAIEFIAQQPQQKTRHVSVTTRELDARLKLPQCPVPLKAYLPPGSKLRANTTVGVRCNAGKTWKLFVPVRLTITGSILVSARSLPAGSVLAPGDFVASQREISGLHGRFLDDNTPIAGKVLRRSVEAGQPLRAAMLTHPTLIKRGQRVFIGTRGKGINIKMAGTAMSDGHQGQRIHVKNTSSGRIVEGVVRSADLIEIRLE